MKFLIRSFIFLSLLYSLAFSKNGDNGLYDVMRDYNLPSTFVPADAKFLKGDNLIGFRMPVWDLYEIISVTIRRDAYYFAGSKSPGFYRDSGYSLYYIGGPAKTGRFVQRGGAGDYEYYAASDNPKDPVFTYYTFLEFNTKSVARCKLNQEFNVDTMQCVDPCPVGQKWDVEKNACVDSCPADQIFNKETGKCEPKLKRPDWCPSPMIYNERKVELLLRDTTVEECLPDPNIDRDKCKSFGMVYHDCADLYGLELTACMSFPEGCYTTSTLHKLEAEQQLESDLFLMGGFMIPLPINAIKNGLTSLSNFFRGLFASGSKAPKINLLEYRPQIVDIKATKAGPEPVFDFKPVDDSAIALNNTFRQTGKIDSAASTSSNIIKSPQKLADVSPNLRKFDLPKDASVSKIENNTIVTAKLKDMSKPIPTKEITVPNQVKNINLDYDLNTMFKTSDKPTPNLPMTIKQTSNAGNKATYKGNIVTPDQSIIDVDVVETTTQTGSRVQDVTYSYTYKTPKGSSKFSTGYVNTIGSDNRVNNSIPKDGTSSSGGNSSGSGNGGSGSSTTTPTQPSQSIDLSSLERAISQSNSKLDSINENLTAIKNQQQEQWNYDPNINTATSFSALQSELAKFDVSVNDAFNFLNNFKSDIDNLMNNFNESLEIFNKGIETPDIPKGTCPFTISGPTPGSQKNNSFVIDPCRIVTPYRSILTLFFTIWFSFEIIMFSLKYLFRVGGES
ncbi:hypothetical protein B9N66_01505 [Campylobacter concisus]|uniref:hypothetical protein n=1 Tax=Campylobacter concisus TaxID=199 RepID=UPI000B3D5232|nr:hypothetical protein [Campylobacter concisus]OUT10077.1 hypothetical protein B9N66_01505 [Campylobacter concisus]